MQPYYNFSHATEECNQNTGKPLYIRGIPPKLLVILIVWLNRDVRICKTHEWRKVVKTKGSKQQRTAKQ